ncbi:MAG: hypothetical protein RIN56_18490 [Sporomusaceae bacterium]|nr:hypothetical protein [Sporomusaceae bacterium]
MRAKLLVLPLALLLAAVLFAPVAQAALPTRTLEGFCGAPWGASQAATKEALAQGPFKAVLEGEDNDILVYRGEFGGYPADFSFIFAAGKLAGGVILIPDPDGAVFKDLNKIHAAKFGPPDLTRQNPDGPITYWLFLSPYKPPPDFAYITTMRTKGAFVENHKHKDRPAVAISCFDDELERQYRQARAAAKNK